jgi:hypothetical protein
METPGAVTGGSGFRGNPVFVFIQSTIRAPDFWKNRYFFSRLPRLPRVVRNRLSAVGHLAVALSSVTLPAGGDGELALRFGVVAVDPRAP